MTCAKSILSYVLSEELLCTFGGIITVLRRNYFRRNWGIIIYIPKITVSQLVHHCHHLNKLCVRAGKVMARRLERWGYNPPLTVWQEGRVDIHIPAAAAVLLLLLPVLWFLILLYCIISSGDFQCMHFHHWQKFINSCYIRCMCTISRCIRIYGV